MLHHAYNLNTKKEEGKKSLIISCLWKSEKTLTINKGKQVSKTWGKLERQEEGGEEIVWIIDKESFPWWLVSNQSFSCIILRTSNRQWTVKPSHGRWLDFVVKRTMSTPSRWYTRHQFQKPVREGGGWTWGAKWWVHFRNKSHCNDWLPCWGTCKIGFKFFTCLMKPFVKGESSLLK